MTPTNNQIKIAFFDALEAAALGYPIAYPGVEFTPPDSGVWLEVMFFPNTGLDNGLAYSSGVVPQGMFQVSCVTRPGSGTIGLGAVADQVRAVFPKGLALSGLVRVIREPYDMEIETMDNQLMIVLTSDYSG